MDITVVAASGDRHWSQTNVIYTKELSKFQSKETLREKVITPKLYLNIWCDFHDSQSPQGLDYVLLL